MKAFEYTTARTVESAAELRGEKGRYLAGGIDLLGEMKEDIVSPSRLVSLKQVSGLRGTSPTADGGLRIGANTTVAEIAAQTTAWPALSEAAAEVASPQIRAVSTLGGNLAQHSRCWYYRQRDLTCLKRGGSTCYGREGQNKYLSILSGNPCVSPVVSNLAVALSALNGRVVVRRRDGEKTLTVAELYADAWSNPLAQNSLAPGDLILAVEVPAPGRSAYLQMSEKSDFDWALVSCAVAGTITDGKVSGVRIVLGAVAPVPYLAEKASAFLEGRTLDEQSVARAADLALADATPLAHNGYKVPVAKTLIRRALLKLAA